MSSSSLSWPARYSRSSRGMSYNGLHIPKTWPCMRRCQPTTLPLAASWICFSELRPTEVTVTWLPLPTIAATWSTTSELSAPVAQVLPPGRAVPAYPAGGDEGAGDVVSDVHPGHAGTCSLDHARALVPAYER